MAYSGCGLPSWDWYGGERELYVQPTQPGVGPGEDDGGYTHSLVFLLNSESVLLGYKNRGFGAGRYNGLGGKLSNETARMCAMRECLEEANITPTLTFTGRINITVQNGESISIALFTASLTPQAVQSMNKSDEITPHILAVDDASWRNKTRPELQIYFPILIDEQKTLFNLNVSFDQELAKDDLPPGERPENHRTLNNWFLTLHNPP